MFTTLIQRISETVILTDSDVELCKRYFEEVRVVNNQIFEKEGQVPAHLYFVVAGFTRLFYADETGEDQTTSLNFAGDFVTSYLAFIHQKEAPESLEAIGECETLRIKHANLKALISQSENFKKFSLIIFENAISSSSKRANDLATLSGDQRYRKLMEDQPGLINHVPVKYIASFLGMKPESLSRIRRQKNS